MTEFGSERGTAALFRRWIWWLAGGLVAAVLLAVVCILLSRSSPEKRLAAIEAARPIPEQENAAPLYARFFATCGDLTPPKGMDPNELFQTRSRPWMSRDHAELGQWLRNQNGTIAAFLEITRVKDPRP